MDKYYIGAQELLLDSFRLANQVFESGLRPHFIVGIWRGGAPIGIAVQEFYQFRGVDTDHIAVRTSSYSEIGQQAKEIRVHGLHYLIENANAEDSLLIVDDVFDSGRSVEALIEQIKRLSRRNTPKDIKIACPWYKPDNNQTSLEPDFYLHKSNKWLVFPHEIQGLSEQELKEGKSDLAEVLSIITSGNND